MKLLSAIFFGPEEREYLEEVVNRKRDHLLFPQSDKFYSGEKILLVASPPNAFVAEMTVDHSMSKWISKDGRGEGTDLTPHGNVGYFTEIFIKEIRVLPMMGAPEIAAMEYSAGKPMDEELSASESSSLEKARNANYAP